MGKRVFQNPVWTPNPFADTTTLTNNNHMSLTATSTTTGLNVQEIQMGGQGGSSAVMIMMFARHSTAGASPAAPAAPASDGPMTSFGGANTGSIAYHLATTGPQRTVNNAAGRLSLTFNAFGGIVRWQAAPFEEWGILGTATNASESSLSGYTGTSATPIGAHIIYESFGT